MDFQKITYPDDLDSDLNNMRILLEGQTREFSMEKRYYHKDGSLVWVNLTVSAMWPVGSPPATHIAIVEDITKRKEAETALQFKTEELDRFFSITLDLLCIADVKKGHFRRLNKAWEKVLGYTLDEMYACNFIDFNHPDDIQPTLDAVATLVDQKEIIDFVNRFRHKDGSYRWIEWRSAPYGNMIYSSARDITERRQTEEELRKRDRDFTRAQSIAHYGKLELGFRKKCCYVVRGIIPYFWR